MSTVSGMSDVPSQHDGWDLHLAPGTVSGYKNVKFLKNNKTRPYSVQFTHAGATKYLGAFATAVEAAVEYAKFVSEGGGGAAQRSLLVYGADDSFKRSASLAAVPSSCRNQPRSSASSACDTSPAHAASSATSACASTAGTAAAAHSCRFCTGSQYGIHICMGL